MEEKNNEELNEILESESYENTIKISDDVVSIIAGKAVSEVEGVYSMAGGFAGGITSSAMDGLKIAECIAKKYKNF